MTEDLFGWDNEKEEPLTQEEREELRKSKQKPKPQQRKMQKDYDF